MAEKKTKKLFTCTTTRPRRMIAAMEKGPGPAKYELPRLVGYQGHDRTKKQNPAYSLSARLKYKFATIGPGPAVYNLETGTTRFGRENPPEWTMAPRLNAPKGTTNVPGPGTYDPLKTGKRCGPRFTMRGRLNYQPYISSPAPNTYTLPPTIGLQLVLYPSNRGFSQQGRPKFGSFTQDLAQSPGPARYSNVPLYLFKSGSPEFTMGTRTSVSYKTTGPGPAMYNPNKVVIDKPIAPKHSFGCKHSEFITPLILQAD